MPFGPMMGLEMYLWIKALHVIAVMSWMAGLLYLPRLMVSHSDVAVGSERDETFKVMERRLLNAILTPAGVVAVLSGGYLIGLAGFKGSETWLLLKLVSVLGLVICHGVLWRHVGAFARGERWWSSRYYRAINEVPTVLMIVIVICVIVKPFG
jgi:protoporphyrinogen IX oxidase